MAISQRSDGANAETNAESSGAAHKTIVAQIQPDPPLGSWADGERDAGDKRRQEASRPRQGHGPGIVVRQSLCCTMRNGHIGSQSWRTGSEIDSQPEAV